MSVNAFSIHDLAGFFATASLSLIFYTVYWTMGRRHLYLLFANLVALAALSCLFIFLADNAVPAGVPVHEVPETEAAFLFWLRWLYAAAAISLPSMCHFVIRYCRVESIPTRHIVWLYAVSVPLALSVWSPSFFSARGEAICSPSSWSCTVPWWPRQGPAFYVYVLVWAAVNVWAQVLLWRYAHPSGDSPDAPLARVRLVQCGILVSVGAALAEMSAVMFGYTGISFFPLSASVMAVMIATALALDGMDQHRWSRALQEANRALKNEIAERERVELERARLDGQLEHLRYLYRLRTALGRARSAQGVIHAAGETVQRVLGAPGRGSLVIEYEDRAWRFGAAAAEGCVRYERALTWGDRERGRLCLFSPTPLTKTQEQALVDETAGQIARALETRELEMQLLQSARLISLGQLAAGVAHELNQPLGAIATTAGDVWLRLVEGVDLPEARLKAMMEEVRHLVNRMSTTIDHLRVFSRDTSRQPGVLFAVNEAVERSLRLVRARLKSHGVVLHLEAAEPLPPVYGHPHLLEQVILNLVTNALDALDEKAAQEAAVHGPREKRLSITTREELEGGRWVVVLVEDNGTGMDEECRQRVFEPFFTTKPADRGTGLGMSISYAIVKDHGGNITCESRKGEGTLFRVALPAAEEA